MKFHISPLSAAKLLLIKKDISIPKGRELYTKIIGILSKDNTLSEVACHLHVEGKDIKLSLYRHDNSDCKIGEITCSITNTINPMVFTVHFSDGFDEDMKNNLSKIISGITAEASLAVSII